MPAANALDKLRNLYDRIQDIGLFIAPEQDIRFGVKKSININLNGTEKVELAKESYNSTLFFTLITSILKRGNMIYFGPPGAGKTTAPEFVGRFVHNQELDDIHRSTIFGHPEQTQEMMVARYALAELMTGTEEVLVREFMKSPVKIIDEVNRLPPGKLSILYQLVDRGFTDYGDVVVSSAEGPTFMTANAADAGNFPLPPPFLDRIGAGVVAIYLNPCYITALEQRGSENLNGGLEKLLEVPPSLRFSPKDLEQARSQIREVEFKGEVLYKLVHFLSESNYCFKAGEPLEYKTKSHAQFKKPGKGLCTDCHYYSARTGNNAGSICYMSQDGISPRSYQSIVLYAKAMAWWRKKDHVEMEDLEAVMPFCIWYKLTPTEKAFEENGIFTNDRISFARHLLERSKETYLKIKQNYDLYDGLLKTSAMALEGTPKKEEVDKLKNEIVKYLDTLKTVDSVAKYPIAVTLARTYYELEAKYGA